jgi:hypothetical protein
MKRLVVLLGLAACADVAEPERWATLSPNLASLRDIVADESGVYLCANGSIQVVVADGLRELGTGDCYDIATDDEWVYTDNWRVEGSEIVRHWKGGGGREVVVQFPPGENSQGLVVHGEQVAFVHVLDEWTPAEIVRTAAAGGGPFEPIAGSSPWVRKLLLDGDDLVWFDPETIELRRAPFAGGASTTIASLPGCAPLPADEHVVTPVGDGFAIRCASNITLVDGAGNVSSFESPCPSAISEGLIADGDRLICSPGIIAIPLDGGSPRWLAGEAVSDSIGPMAVDETHLWFATSTNTGSALYRISRDAEGALIDPTPF